MAKQQRPREESAKDVVSADSRAATPMERFRGLTRQLLGVSREQLKTAQKRYEENKEHET
jgi:hypothetical protein